jgi:AraC-like DNA-binding protein
MPKIVFSSDELPAHLDDHARFKLWREIFFQRFGVCDFHHDDQKQFSAAHEFTLLGRVIVTRQYTTVDGYARTPQHVAADARDDYLIAFNRSPVQPLLAQYGRELSVGTGELALYTNADAIQARMADHAALIGVCLPRALLLERLRHADDLVMRPLDSTTPAVRHLEGYLGLLTANGALTEDPRLLAHVETTLVDLIALALGADRDAGHVARMRGQRAARLHEILHAISTNFADPACSARTVAHKLGLSPRYVNELLQETGSSLAERVLELRLQQARAMLADSRYDRLKVVEIAYACGFNEVSYFNRCFRRRFGTTPTQFRGGPGNGA